MSDENTPDVNSPESDVPVTPVEAQEAKAKAVSVQPETIRKGIRPRTAKRLAIMAVILAGLVYGFYWFIGLKGDLQLGSDTSTMISAIKLQDQGSQAVVIDPDGKVTESPNYVAGKSDRDLAWDPKGNRLFFISDRKEDSFHIFRWDPQRGAVDQKSIDRAGRSNLAFDAEDKGIGELIGLVIVRGTVQEFTPQTAKSRQVMPPTIQGSQDPEGGSSSTFELIYKRYGRSFKAAQWFGGRRYIAAVMTREDRGQSLIIQDSLPDEKGQTKPPELIFIAEKINLAVDPSTGNLVFSITEVLPVLGADGSPVLGPDGKEQKYGFSHGMFMLEPTDGKLQIKPIGTSPDSKVCFGSPVPSPDGKRMMFLVGNYAGEGNMDVTAIESCELVVGGIQNHTTIAQGNVSDPSYSPNGARVVYVMQDGGQQAIFIANSDGTGAKNLTGAAGDFSAPHFSPQFK